MHRLLLIPVATTMLLIAACGGTDSSANPNYVEPDFPDNATQEAAVLPSTTGPSAVVTAAEDAPPADAVDDTTREALVESYDSFLRLRAQAVMSERAIDDLDGVATDAAMAQVLTLRNEVDQAHADGKYSALTSLIEWSNVTTARNTGSSFTFTDCTERHIQNSNGTPLVRFVTNEVTMVQVDDRYKVDDVSITHEGNFAMFVGDFGCVPPSFIERAEETAAFAIAEVASMFADPGQFNASNIADTFDGEAREELAYVVDLLDEQGLSRRADESVELRVLGMDTNKEDFTVVVEVCRYFPNGRTYVQAATGQSTQSDLARGSSEREWMFVQLESVPKNQEAHDVVTRVEAKGADCWGDA